MNNQAIDLAHSGDTFARLAAILVRDYKLDPLALTPQSRLDALGIDSLGVAELLFNVEDAFGIALPPEPVDLPTLADVVRFIDTLRAGRQALLPGGEMP